MCGQIPLILVSQKERKKKRWEMQARTGRNPKSDSAVWKTSLVCSTLGSAVSMFTVVMHVKTTTQNMAMSSVNILWNENRSRHLAVRSTCRSAKYLDVGQKSRQQLGKEFQATTNLMVQSTAAPFAAAYAYEDTCIFVYLPIANLLD